jgi:hypothetical protein
MCASPDFPETSGPGLILHSELGGEPYTTSAMATMVTATNATTHELKPKESTGTKIE